MTDLFLNDEASVESSKPREFYDIVQSNAVVYHVASGQQDLVYNGITYTASPSSRSNVGMPAAAGTDVTPTLILPLSHPFCQRYVALGSPPQQPTVTVWRQQLHSGVVEQIWFGYVTAIAFDSKGSEINASDAGGAQGGHVAKFTIPSRMSRSLSRSLPIIMTSRLCPHTLYDAQCTVNPASFSKSTTVVSVNGNQVTVNTTFTPTDYTLGGDITHTASGEIQTVLAQGANVGGQCTLTMQAPIPEMMAGDAVVVRAGCDHTMGTCIVEFANQVNYGGFNDIPNLNPTIPTGIVQALINDT
jgi:Phage conserved hypothetical protein BR0599